MTYTKYIHIHCICIYNVFVLYGAYKYIKHTPYRDMPYIREFYFLLL